MCPLCTYMLIRECHSHYYGSTNYSEICKLSNAGMQPRIYKVQNCDTYVPRKPVALSGGIRKRTQGVGGGEIGSDWFQLASRSCTAQRRASVWSSCIRSGARIERGLRFGLIKVYPDNSQTQLLDTELLNRRQTQIKSCYGWSIPYLCCSPQTRHIFLLF